MKSTIVNSLYSRQDKPVNEIIYSFSPTNLYDEIKLILANEEDDDPESYVTFQVDLCWKSTVDRPKYNFQQRSKDGNYNGINLGGWGKKFPAPDYQGIDWHTVKTSVNCLVELVRHGFVVRFGVKEGSNDKSDFQFAQFLGFDLDKDPSMTWEDVILVCQEYLFDPLCIYYSPSGDETNNKYRMIVALDRKLNYSEYEDLTTRIAKLLPNCNLITSPDQFWFGTIKPILYESKSIISVNDLFTNLPPVEIEKVQKPESNIVLSKDLTKTQKLLNCVTTEIIQKKYDGDPTILIDKWIDELNLKGANLHKGKWINRGSQNGSIVSWNGRDPILGGSTPDSDSFVVSLNPDGGIYFSSRASNFHGSNLIKLRYHLEMESWESPELSNGGFIQHAQEIFTQHELNLVDYYQPIASSTLAKQSIKGFPDWINESNRGYSINPGLMFREFCAEHQGRFFRNEKRSNWYLYQHDYWRTLTDMRFRGFIKDWAENQITAIDDTRLYNSKVINSVNCDLSSLSEKYAAINSFPLETRYLSFPNGLFNIQTKKLEPFNSSVYCQYKFDFDYQDLSQDTSGSDSIRAFLNWILDEPDQSKRAESIEDLIMWLCCVYQLQGYDTRRFLMMVGSPGAGKSDFTSFVSMPFESVNEPDKRMVGTVSSKCMIDPKDDFGRSGLIGKTLVILSEFKGLGHDSDPGIIKTLIGGARGTKATMSVNAKYCHPEEIDFRLTFITNSETYPNLRNQGREEDGWYRRLLIAPFRKNLDQRDEIFTPMKSKDMAIKFFLWAIHQDIEPFLVRCQRDNCFDSWMGKAKKDMAMSNNHYANFVSSSISFDLDLANQKKGIQSVSLYHAYVEWLRSEDGRANPGSQSRFSKEMKKAISLIYPESATIELVSRKEKGNFFMGVTLEDIE